MESTKDLKVENPIEELEDTTEVSLEYDPESYTRTWLMLRQTGFIT